MSPRSGKRSLLDLIEVCYKHGYGPRRIATMTGYSYQSINRYAGILHLKIGTTRPVPPGEPPREVLMALFKWTGEKKRHGRG